MVETVGLLLLNVVGAALGIEGLAGLSLWGVSLASVVGAVAISAAVIGLQMALRPSPPKGSDGHQSTRQEIPPRVFGWGRTRLPGAYMLYEATGGTSYDIIALAGGKIAGIVTYYLHDDVVILNVLGVVTEAVGFDDDRYTEFVQIKTRLGLPTETAYSEAVAALPALWTAAHRGDNIASLELICRGVKLSDFQREYPHGLPNPTVAADMFAVWDPRDDDQDPDDPATWIDHPEYDEAETYGIGDRVLYGGYAYYSRAANNIGNEPGATGSKSKWTCVAANPVLQMINFTTNTVYGMSLPRAMLIDPVLDKLIIEANICDTLVIDKAGDYAPRYESNGFAFYENDPGEVQGRILSTCDGWMTLNGEGALALTVGLYRAPTVPAIEQRHIYTIDPDYGIADEEVCNELKMTFTSPDHVYKEIAGAILRDEEDISRRGKVRSQNLSLPWVQAHPQARRLQKRQFARLTPRIKGTMTTTLFGDAVMGARWIPLQTSLAGLEDVIVEVIKAKTDWMAGTCTFEWKLINPNTIDAWDPATEEGALPAVPTDGGADLLPIPLFPAAVVRGVDDLNLNVELSFDQPNREDLSLVIRYREADDGSGDPGPWIEQPISQYTITAGRGIVQTTLLKSAALYLIQLAFVGPRGSYGAWSDTVSVSASLSSLDFSLPQNSGYLVLLEDI